jgi:hypothetical protein
MAAAVMPISNTPSPTSSIIRCDVPRDERNAETTTFVSSVKVGRAMYQLRKLDLIQTSTAASACDIQAGPPTH